MKLSEKYPHTFRNLQCLLFPEEYSIYHYSISELALSLYQHLDPQFTHDFTDRDLVIAWLFEINHRHEGAKPTIELSFEIKKSRQLIKQFLLSFMTTTLPKSSITHDLKIYESYKALTLSVVIQLILYGTHEYAYKQICNEMRRFANGRRNDLTSYLPIIKDQSFMNLIQELEAQRNKATEQHLISISAQVSRYIVPYDAIFYGREEIIKTSPKKHDKTRVSLYRKSINDINTQHNIIHEIAEKFKKGKTKSISEHEEKDSTPVDIKIFNIEFEKQTYEPIANHLLAKAISQSIGIRKLKLPTQVDILTNKSIEIIVQHCLNDIDNPAAQLLMLVLSTGQSPEKLCDIKFEKPSSNVYFHRRHRLPSYEQSPDFRKFIPKVAHQLLITLPSFINIPTSLSITNAIPDAKLIISTVNKAYNLNLTLERLRLHLRTWLTKNSIDSAILSVLCGDDLKQQPSMYYTFLDKKCVIETYKHYLMSIFPSKFTASLPDTADVNIGSNLPVFDEVIAKQLTKIKLNWKCRVKG